MPRKPRLVPEPPFDPIHPFDQQYGVETGGLIPAKELQTGHPSDRRSRSTAIPFWTSARVKAERSWLRRCIRFIASSELS
jgi:hypothetical protein